MTYIGIDLSLTGTGVVVLTNGKVVEKLIKSKPTKNKTYTEEIERILNIKKQIISVIEEHEPELVLIEGMAFMARNTTALVQLAGLNYLIREYLFQYNIPFAIVAPTSLKKFITGNGAAKKDVMLMEIYKKYDIAFVDDNIADGFALAKIGECVMNDCKLNKTEQEVITLIRQQV